MINRFYPSTERFLLNDVAPEDLYDYLFHGFGLANIDGIEKYFSCCLTKPMIFIPRDNDIDEIFRPKAKEESNISLLIRLLVKVRLTGYHNGDNENGWEKLDVILASPEFKDTLSDFEETVRTMIGRMFPNYVQKW